MNRTPPRSKERNPKENRYDPPRLRQTSARFVSLSVPGEAASCNSSSSCFLPVLDHHDLLVLVNNHRDHDDARLSPTKKVSTRRFLLKPRPLKRAGPEIYPPDLLRHKPLPKRKNIVRPMMAEGKENHHEDGSHQQYAVSAIRHSTLGQQPPLQKQVIIASFPIPLPGLESNPTNHSEFKAQEECKTPTD